MSENKNLSYYLLLASCLLLFLDYFGRLNLPKSQADFIIIPIKKNVFDLFSSSYNFVTSMKNCPESQKTYKQLVELKQNQEEQDLQISLLTEENKRLRMQLEAPLSSAIKYIPARVIDISRYMEIDMGKKQGVRDGMPVVDGTALIGKIVKVEEDRSLVMLPTDLESAIPVKTLRETKGVLMGQSGGTIVFDKILQKEPLLLDDQVVTSGEAGFPINLLVGKVVHIVTDETNVYKKAKVEPVLDYFSSRYVFVLAY